MANVLVPSSADRRTVFGVALTFVWVTVGAVYIGRGLGWQRFFEQPLASSAAFRVMCPNHSPTLPTAKSMTAANFLLFIFVLPD